MLTALATRVRHRSVLRRVDRVAIAACLAGLVLIAAGSGTERPDTVPWWAVLALVAYSRALALINVARLTAVMVVSETAVPGILGVVILGDAIRPGWWGAVLTGLTFAIAGVVVLAGSPAVDQPAARTR